MLLIQFYKCHHLPIRMHVTSVRHRRPLQQFAGISSPSNVRSPGRNITHGTMTIVVALCLNSEYQARQLSH